MTDENAAPVGFDLPSGPHPDGRVAWLRYAVLCDGVRTEQNGKRILIGCYDTSVVFSQKPGVFSARLIGGFEFVKPGHHVLEFRITTPTAQGMGQMETLSDAEPGGYAPFEVPVEAFVSEPAEIRLDWRLDGGDWGPPMIWRLEFGEGTQTLTPDAERLVRETWNAMARARGAGEVTEEVLEE